MGRGHFRGAIGVAVAMAVATWVVAAAYDLPVRDPDGVSVPTWVRLPVIVLAAVLVDVLARWAAYLRTTPRPGAWAALRTVVRARWTREQVWFTLSGLVAWYVAYVAFRNLKSYVPFVNDRLWDTELHRLDRLLWLGHDPAAVLHQVLGTGWAAWLLSGVYVLWIGLVPASAGDRAGVDPPLDHRGASYVTAVSFDWLLGVAVYYARPVPGADLLHARRSSPACRARPTPRCRSCCSTTASPCWPTPWDTRAVQTIAAFASLHVAIMVTICLVAELLRLPRWCACRGWAFLALTCLATVYLGWHFFVDVLGGFGRRHAGPGARRLDDRPPAAAPRPDVDARRGPLPRGGAGPLLTGQPVARASRSRSA